MTGVMGVEDNAHVPFQQVMILDTLAFLANWLNWDSDG